MRSSGNEFNYVPENKLTKLANLVQLALARVFWIHLLEVCWTFAGSCKLPITSTS